MHLKFVISAQFNARPFLKTTEKTNEQYSHK